MPAGSELTARAATAFTDAFTLTNSVALGMALAGAAAVLASARRAAPAIEPPMADGDPPSGP